MSDALEEHVPKVVNTHWFGSMEKLPANTIYIGRPSAHGNPYSSKTGKYTREECIALHRIDLYYALKEDPTKLASLKAELGGHDLACWCKQPKKVVGCHGDTFLHVLSPAHADRTYTKSVLSYLMEDLRLGLKQFHDWVLHEVDQSEFLFLSVYDDEVRLEINNVLHLCKLNEARTTAVEYLIARLAIEMELANKDRDIPMVKYRIDHMCWVINNFIAGRSDRAFEPSPPDLPTLKKPKGSKS